MLDVRPSAPDHKCPGTSNLSWDPSFLKLSATSREKSLRRRAPRPFFFIIFFLILALVSALLCPRLSVHPIV